MMNKELELTNNRISNAEKGIYIHIPFCVQKCLYCDFLSWQASTKEVKTYVDNLVKEISLYQEINMSKEINPSKVPIDVPSIFFGGGTPSLLEPVFVERIINAIRSNFHVETNAEITIECNPGTVSLEKLTKYKSYGINRISLGLQSTNNNELKALGRIHTYEQFLDSFTMARQVGFDNINIDLISALPDQTVESWKESLTKVIALKPEHISAYSLILEEGTQLYEMVEQERKQKINRIPNEDIEREMYYLTNNLLKEAGYLQYEISNYAKEGFMCQHNLIYWAPNDYIGFGLGAASYTNGIRYHNTEDLLKYNQILNDADNTDKTTDLTLLKEDITFLTNENKMEEYMFLGLRRINGISVKEFYQRFCVPYEEIYDEVTNKFIKEGLLIRKSDRIFLSEKGIDISNYVMSDFLL